MLLSFALFASPVASVMVPLGLAAAGFGLWPAAVAAVALLAAVAVCCFALRALEQRRVAHAERAAHCDRTEACP